MSAPVFRRCMARKVSGVERQRMPGDLAGSLKIDRLATDHSARAGCFANDAQRLELSPHKVGIRRHRLSGEQYERLRLQRITGKNRDAVAVDDVQRRPAAPERVVVHRREVVVNQRVGMDEFDGTRGGEGVWHRVACRVAVHGVGGGQGQNRAKSLSAGHHAIAHRLAEERRTGRWLRQPAVRAPGRRGRGRVR